MHYPAGLLLLEGEVVDLEGAAVLGDRAHDVVGCAIGDAGFDRLTLRVLIEAVED